MLFDRPSWIAFATSLPLPQQAGIPCIFIALAAAASELKLASNSRYESAELRARAKYKTAEERERAARRHQLQARSLRAGALFQLEPSPLHRRFLSLIAIELAAEQQQN